MIQVRPITCVDYEGNPMRCEDCVREVERDPKHLAPRLCAPIARIAAQAAIANFDEAIRREP